ncbi:MAG: zinc ribbon domain-containing protein [Candidatus Methanomethylophilaceae archaeon]|nr:zinc ribbon domain-containing protein [Candidatus Methanomethylophilaceae archaeon]
MAENDKFCTKCGQNLSASVRFCPACGARVQGPSDEEISAEKGALVEAMTGRLKLAAVMMAVYSVPFLILGIYCIVDASGLATEVFKEPAFAEAIAYYGLTQAEVADLFGSMGILYILSSVFGLASAFLCYRRKMYWVALIACILSFLTGVAGLFALFMGLLAFWMILGGRFAFEEYADELDQEFEKLKF